MSARTEAKMDGTKRGSAAAMFQKAAALGSAMAALSRPALHFATDDPDDAAANQSLLEELGMIMPTACSLTTGPSQVLSGDLSVGEAVHKRKSIHTHRHVHSNAHAHQSNRRMSRHSVHHHRASIKAARGKDAGSTPRGGTSHSARETGALGTEPDYHRKSRISVVHRDEEEMSNTPRSASAKAALPPLDTGLGDFDHRTATISKEQGSVTNSGDGAAVASDRRSFKKQHTLPLHKRLSSEAAPSAAMKSLTKNVHKIMTLTKFLGPGRITSHEGDSEKARSRVIKENNRSERMLIVEELTRMAIFSSCSQGFLGELARTVEEKTIPDGGIMSPEDSCTRDPHMVLVLRGSLQVIVAGTEVLRRSSNEYFGEAVLLGLQQDWGCKLKAEATTVVLLVYREDFVSALRFFPSERSLLNSMRDRFLDHMTDGTLTQRCVVFNGFCDETMVSLDKNILTRIYSPGEHILSEGRPGDELYMLVSGIAGVEIAGRVVRQERRDAKWKTEGSEDEKEAFLSGPLCFGELGLLGMQQVRSATVVAQTFCHVRVLYRSVFLSILEQNGEAIQMEEMADLLAKRHKDPQKPSTTALKEVGIFQEVGCSDKFLDFLAEHLEDRIFLPGQKIIDETVPDDRCMYLLGQGIAKVSKHGREVAILSSGAVFGEIIVLGLASKRSASVLAAETCYMQVLHQSVVVRGLELFPEERRKVLMMAFSSSGLAVAEPTEEEPNGLPVAFLKALNASSLFSSIDAGFVEDLRGVAHDRIYMPGDLIIEEGKRGDSMFIMVSGQATVFVHDPDHVMQDAHEPTYYATNNGKVLHESTNHGKRHDGHGNHGKHHAKKNDKNDHKKVPLSRIGVLTAGSISGELAMLGISLIRSATIEAQTICSMWEITQEKALAILDKYPAAQRHFATIIVEHLERTVPARILSSPLFRGFDRKFRMLLGLYSERRAYFPGHRIAREGQTGDKMYMVNQGRATLEKKGVTVKTYASGSFFGSTLMLGVHKVYLGTLVALQTCHIIIISQNTYNQALEQYPSLLASQELKKTEKAASEELREAIQRISARKLIWKRCQCQLLDSLGNPDMKRLTEAELMERALQVWSDRVKEIVKNRRARERERGQYRQMMEQWVSKKQQAREYLQQKNEQLLPGELRPSTVSSRPLAHRKELVQVLQHWPAPRPSPHYRLNVFGLLHEAAARPATGAPLLPLLKDIRNGGCQMLGEAEGNIEARQAGTEDQRWRRNNDPFENGEGLDSPLRSEGSAGEEFSGISSDYDALDYVEADHMAEDAEELF